MSSLTVFTVALALVSLQKPPQMTVGAGTSRVLITNANTTTAEGLEKGQKHHHVVLTGSPVQVQSPAKGFTATGNAIDMRWEEIDAKTTSIEQARVEGKATMFFDDSMAQASLVEEAKRLHKPEPAAKPESSTMKAQSELFNYAGSAHKGTLTMPVPWTFRQVSKGTGTREDDGKKVNFTYDQTFDMDGTKGVLNLIQGKTGAMDRVSTGHLNGPVHFKVVRHEQVVGKVEVTTSTYSGVADEVDIDLTKDPGTIVTHGHVIVDIDSAELTVHWPDLDSFTLKVDDQMQVTGFSNEGHPAVMTAQTKGGGK